MSRGGSYWQASSDGPFPGDGSNGPDVLEQSGIVRSDIRSSFGDATGTADGVPMTLELTISDLANDGAPFAGAAVYVWHCIRDGRYSLYSEGVTEENYLRGVQIADSTNAIATSQVALPQDVCETVYAESGYEESVRSLSPDSSQATCSAVRLTSSARSEPCVSLRVRGPMSGNVGNGWCST